MLSADLFACTRLIVHTYSYTAGFFFWLVSAIYICRVCVLVFRYVNPPVELCPCLMPCLGGGGGGGELRTYYMESEVDSACGGSCRGKGVRRMCAFFFVSVRDISVSSCIFFSRYFCRCFLAREFFLVRRSSSCYVPLNAFLWLVF